MFYYSDSLQFIDEEFYDGMKDPSRYGKHDFIQKSKWVLIDLQKRVMGYRKGKKRSCQERNVHLKLSLESD